MFCGATVNLVKSSAAVPLPWPCSSFEPVHLWVSHSVKLNNSRRLFTSCAVASTSSSSVSSCSSKKKVLIPIGYGTEEMEAVIMAGILRTAGAEVTIASVEPETLQVELSGGMRMVADTYISCCSDENYDLVALPGGMPGSARLRDCNVLKQITSRQAEEKRLYSAISAAPAVTLLPWGLLKRKKATCHPAFMDKLPTFWAVKTSTQVSGELTTSRGPGTSFEFALTSVEHLYSDTVAKDVRDALLLRGAKDHPRRTEYNEEDWTSNQIPTVLVPVGNDSVEIEVVSVVDILRRANVNVVVASVEKSLQLSACQGTKIIADQLIGTAAQSTFDVIILPGEGSGSNRLQRSRALKTLLKEQKISSRVYGAMGSSLTLLQKQGLVKGKRVAAHPSIIEENEVVVDEAGVVIDGKVITSNGFSSVTDFALSIVGKLFGQARARSVAEGLVFDYPRS